jgi:streptogramin lyase
LTVQADLLSGYGQLSGTVTGSQPGVLPVVYAYNHDKDVAYTVFVIDGKYRAVNLIPGSYSVTIRPAVDQLEGFTPETVEMDVGADVHVTADFALKNVGPVPNYVNGLPYEPCTANRPTPENAAKLAYAVKHGGVERGKAIGDCEPYVIQPYDEIFPPGPGRDIMERTCLACHHVQLFAFNTPRTYGGGRSRKNKAAWAYNVDRKIKRIGWRGPLGLGRASHMDPELLPPKDRDILVDYLAENFGFDAPSRLVQLRSEPELDLQVLEKAQWVEYIYHEDPDKFPVWPWPHRVDFDSDGNVWLAYNNCCIVRFDPRTGESTAFDVGGGGGYGIAVDHSDGTVWYSPANRLDPETGLIDRWQGAGGGSIKFDTKGNLWMAGMGGTLMKWDRKTTSIMAWDVPVARSRPYGMIVDFTDKVWFADYFTSGVTRFDPETEEFRHFNITKERPSNIRRLGVDSKNMIWTATYGNPNRRRADGRNMGGSLFRLNPETGEVMQRNLGIENSNPYNAEADPDDNIWVNPDNYLVKYDQKADTFTRYPAPTRTDFVKTRITRDGAVWTVYRNAGHYAGYGGSAAVLYPDKDKIETLAAYHPENGAGHHASKYKGPLAPKVTGGIKVSYGKRNNKEFEKWAIAAGLPGPDFKPDIKDTE